MISSLVEVIKPYVIGVALGLCMTAVIYMIWLYEGNKKLRQINEDLKTLDEEERLRDAARKLTDQELADQLDATLSDSHPSRSKPNGRA